MEASPDRSEDKEKQSSDLGLDFVSIADDESEVNFQGIQSEDEEKRREEVEDKDDSAVIVQPNMEESVSKEEESGRTDAMDRVRAETRPFHRLKEPEKAKAIAGNTGARDVQEDDGTADSSLPPVP